MEAIYAKLNQLEKQLEQRQSLESIIRQMNMNLQAGGSLRKEDHEHIYSIMICLRTIVDEEKEMLVDSCAEIMKRLRTNSDELEEYRQELIKVNTHPLTRSSHCSNWDLDCSKIVHFSSMKMATILRVSRT